MTQDDARTRVAKALNFEYRRWSASDNDWNQWDRMADAAIAAMAEPPVDPYTELIDKLAEIACDSWYSDGAFEHDEYKDNWRNVAKAVIDVLREGVEERITATPVIERTTTSIVDAALPKEPNA